MAATVTVTGTAGPGQTVTAAVFTDVTSFSIDCVNNLISITPGDGTANKIISITAATTITATKSGSTYTLTIS